MVRGIDTSNVFHDDQDQTRHLDRFGQAAQKEAEEKQKRLLKLKGSSRTIKAIIKQECKRNEVSVEELPRGNRRIRISETRLTIERRSKSELACPEL